VKARWDLWHWQLGRIPPAIQFHMLGDSPLKHADLVAQNQVLELKGSMRTEDQRQSCEEYRE
jgi:hypothetical protein